MEYLSIAGSVFSAMQGMQQAKSQKAMYKLQALQTQAESERKALQYEQRANDTLRNLNKAIASNLSRGYAGGVAGFEGSTALINTASGRDAGKDFMFDIQNAENALLAGTTQAEIYGIAGKTAYTSGMFSAAAGLAEAGYKYSKIGSAPAPTSTTPSLLIS